MLPRRLLALSALAAVPLVAACGSKPQTLPEAGAAAKPGKLLVVKYPNAGVTLKAPRGWRRTRGKYPRVAALSSGKSVLAIWAYKRKEPGPQSKEELETAKTRLVKQIKRRNKRYDVKVSRIRALAGRPAIEVSGVQRIAGLPFKTRSIHIFKRNAEYVFEALAPANQFAQLEKGVLKPALTSMKLTGKVKEPKKPKRKKSSEDEKKDEKKDDENKDSNDSKETDEQNSG